MKKKNHPLRIGLTGGIGSGKTTVSKILSTFGVPIFNSDHFSKELLRSDKKIISLIKKNISESILIDGKIDRKKLAKVVFENKEKLKTLNNIIHPIVIQEYNKWVTRQKTKYVIKESAILFESMSYKKLDKIILITAPLSLRIKRIIARDQRDKKEIESIIKNQYKTKEILKKADYIINNNEKKLLLPQVIKLHQKLSTF